MQVEELTSLELGTHRIRWDGRYNWVLADVVTRTPRKGGDQYEGEDNTRFYNTLEEAAEHLLLDRIGYLGNHSDIKALIKAIRQCKAELQAEIVSEIKRGYSG